MKYAVLTVFMIIISVVQTTVLKSMEIFGVVPNLLVVAVICYALMRGDFRSIVFGAAAGFVLDLLSGRMVGMNMILCSVTALFCACLYENLFNNNPFVASIFVLWISAVYEFLIYVFYFLFWGNGDVVFALLHKVLPCAVYNAVSAFAIYPLMKFICSFDKAEE